MNFVSLDRESAVPLYYEIQQQLLEQIRAGAFRPGQNLLSEHDIAQQLGVSRMTGRQALKSLHDLGLTYSVRGKGTFVSAIKLEKDLRQVESFTESKVICFASMQPDKEAASALRLYAGESVVSLRRVRLANASPMGVEWSRIPQRVCPDLLETFDPRASLYETLAQRYGIRVAIADEIVEAGLAGSEEARLLGIAKKSPVFLFTRISYLQNGKPIEFVKSVYRADRYKIVNRLTRLNRELRLPGHKPI